MSHTAGDGGGGYPRILPSASGEIQINYEVLRDVYRALVADFDSVQEDTSPALRVRVQKDGKGEVLSVEAEITEEVLLTGVELGRYPAAEGTNGMDGLSGTCRNAHDQISAVYSQFLTAYGHLIGALKKSADNHSEAEHRNVEAMNRTYTDVPSSNPSSQFYA